MDELDPFNPASYLAPADLARVDQAEARIAEQVEGVIESFVKLMEEDDASISTWALLMRETMAPGQMANALAYLIITEAKRRVDV